MQSIHRGSGLGYRHHASIRCIGQRPCICQHSESDGLRRKPRCGPTPQSGWHGRQQPQTRHCFPRYSERHSAVVHRHRSTHVGQWVRRTLPHQRGLPRWLERRQRELPHRTPSSTKRHVPIHSTPIQLPKDI